MSCLVTTTTCSVALSVCVCVQGWEEIVDKAVTHMLKTTLAKSHRDQSTGTYSIHPPHLSSLQHPIVPIFTIAVHSWCCAVCKYSGNVTLCIHSCRRMYTLSLPIVLDVYIHCACLKCYCCHEYYYSALSVLKINHQFTK